VLGYDVQRLAFNDNATGSLNNVEMPDVVLVKKFYKRRGRRRIWYRWFTVLLLLRSNLSLSLSLSLPHTIGN
jgi:hypothetical protein